MNPCKDWCFARFGKEYTKECDKHCFVQTWNG